MTTSVATSSKWFFVLGILAFVLCGAVMTGCVQAGQTAANSESQSEAVDESGEEASDTATKQADENANQQKASDDSKATSSETTSKNDTPAPAIETESVPVNDAETPNVAMANLGINVLRELNIATKNVMISPFSLSAALSLTANGAEGETRTELEHALGLPVDKLNEAFADYEALSDSIELPLYDEDGSDLGTYEQQVFSCANSVWLGKKLLPQQSFLDVANNVYKAEIQVVDGTSDATVINNWVDKHTNEMIPTIVEDDFQVDSQGLALINAVTFECAWRQPYFDGQVEPGIFTSSGGEDQDARFLCGEEWGYLENPYATGFVKDYADTRFAFAALLPSEGTTPEMLLDEMSGEELCEFLKHADAKQNVVTVMPEFENTFEVTLNDALKALGVRRAFEWGRANFSGITDGPLWIDSVLQKTYVSVDKIGTKAAAVTAEFVAGAAPIEEPPPVVRLDRPFVYIIFETESTTPLFIGVVNSLE